MNIVSFLLIQAEVPIGIARHSVAARSALSNEPGRQAPKARISGRFSDRWRAWHSLWKTGAKMAKTVALPQSDKDEAGHDGEMGAERLAR